MLNGFSLLVVEDDRDSREAIRETLEASGATVRTASSASEALAALAAREFDLVVSDLAMPDQSGFWLINKIRQVFHRRHVPVIAVTGHPFPRSRECGAPGSTTSCRSPRIRTGCARPSRRYSRRRERHPPPEPQPPRYARRTWSFVMSSRAAPARTMRPVSIT